MALNTAATNAMLDNLGTLITFISLHTNAVGSGSGGEVTGGSPPYARKAASWAAASGGSKALQATLPVFDVPATTVARAGFFSAVTAGTYYGDAELVDEVFAAQGTYSITAGTIAIT